MAVSFELPTSIEETLREQLGNLDQAAREVLLVDAYRHGWLSRRELSESLGLDRLDTNAVLQRHQVFEGSLTFEDLELQRQILSGAPASEDR